MEQLKEIIPNIENVNDQAPVFDEQMYSATVAENAEQGTPIVKVTATDLDDGDFGHVTYKLEGTYQDDFQIGHEDGTISVVNSGLLDRERVPVPPHQPDRQTPAAGGRPSVSPDCVMSHQYQWH